VLLRQDRPDEYPAWTGAIDEKRSLNQALFEDWTERYGSRIDGQRHYGILPTFLSKDLPIKYFKHIVVKELAEMHGKLVIAWKKETYHYKPEIKTVAKDIQNIFKKAVVPQK